MDSKINRARGKAVQALCAVTWLCAACVCTLEPRFRAPSLPVADRWPIPATVQPSVNIAASDIGWRDFFLDTRLQQLLGLALANNRDLRVAVLNIEQARAQYRIQRAALLPSIDAPGSLTHEKLPASLTYGISTPILGYFDVGLSITSYEVERSDYAARQRLITTRLAEENNRVTLYKALGGGWREQSP